MSKKIWYITGASKGFGLALAKLALANGDAVAATSRSKASLEENIAAQNDNFLPLQVDITSDKMVKQSVEETIASFGRIDVVVNNAGYALVGSMEEITDEEFRQMIDVNLFGTVNVIRAVMPYRRIRVNALSPGSIDTPVFGKIVQPEQVESIKQLWKNMIPIGRMGLPAEIGKTAVFLASDDSSFIVGTEILADGGMTNISLMK